tara:strand:- start:232 stop:489 length:258 start_codon:yes stop_codon:yes gene_type:complete
MSQESAATMSYTHGPHCKSEKTYYRGDYRVGTYEPHSPHAPPPAWLMADWMLAKQAGQPISDHAQLMCEVRTDNKAILWLRDYLR